MTQKIQIILGKNIINIKEEIHNLNSKQIKGYDKNTNSWSQFIFHSISWKLNQNSFFIVNIC